MNRKNRRSYISVALVYLATQILSLAFLSDSAWGDNPQPTYFEYPAGRKVEIPDERYRNFWDYFKSQGELPSRVSSAQQKIDAMAKKLGLKYQPKADPELMARPAEKGGPTRGSTNQTSKVVSISPDIADDPQLLECTMVHEDVHVQQIERFGPAKTSVDVLNYEISAHQKEIEHAKAKGFRHDLIDTLEGKLKQLVNERDTMLGKSPKKPPPDDQSGGGSDTSDDKKPPRDDRGGGGGGGSDEGQSGSGLNEELSKKSAKDFKGKKIQVVKFETPNRMLKELIAEKTPEQLKPLGNVAEHETNLELTEEDLRLKVENRLSPKAIRELLQPARLSDARLQTARDRVRPKLVSDGIYGMQKARGEALWGSEGKIVSLLPEELGAIVKTRGFLKILIDRKPAGDLLKGLRETGPGEAGALIGPLLVDTAVAWYDNGWQTGLATLGLEGSLTLTLMFAAHNSPLLAAGFQYAMPYLWPVIVFHVTKGSVYLAGSLFLDYLVRDDMIRVMYLESGSSSKIQSFFESPEGKGLTRETLYTRYKSFDEVGAGIDRYKAWLEQEPEGTMWSVFYTLRDDKESKKVWQRIKDKAKADWFDGISKEMERAFKELDVLTRSALDISAGRAEVLRSFANRAYTGAQGFVLDVRQDPEKPNANEKVSIEVAYAVAGVTGYKVVVDLSVEFSGPGANQVENAFKQKEVTFTEDQPLVAGVERVSFDVTQEGGYKVTARLEVRDGQSDRMQIAFDSSRCVDDKIESFNNLMAQMQGALQRAQKAANQIEDARKEATDAIGQSQDVTAKLKAIKQRSPTLAQECEQAVKTVGSIKGQKEQINKVGEHISILRDTIGALSETACKLADQSQREADLTKISNLIHNAGQFAEQSKKKAEEAKGEAGKAYALRDQAVNEFSEIQSLQQRVDELQKDISALDDPLKSMRESLKAVSAKVPSAQGFAAEVAAEATNAQTLMNRIEQLVGPCTTQKETLIGQAYQRLTAVKVEQERAVKGSAELQGTLQREQTETTSLRNSVEKIRGVLSGCDPLNEDMDAIVQDMKATADTIEVLVNVAEESTRTALDCATKVADLGPPPPDAASDRPCIEEIQNLINLGKEAEAANRKAREIVGQTRDKVSEATRQGEFCQGDFSSLSGLEAKILAAESAISGIVDSMQQAGSQVDNMLNQAQNAESMACKYADSVQGSADPNTEANLAGQSALQAQGQSSAAEAAGSNIRASCSAIRQQLETLNSLASPIEKVRRCAADLQSRLAEAEGLLDQARLAASNASAAVGDIKSRCVGVGKCTGILKDQTYAASMLGEAKRLCASVDYPDDDMESSVGAAASDLAMAKAIPIPDAIGLAQKRLEVIARASNCLPTCEMLDLKVARVEKVALFAKECATNARAAVDRQTQLASNNKPQTQRPKDQPSTGDTPAQPKPPDKPGSSAIQPTPVDQPTNTNSRSKPTDKPNTTPSPPKPAATQISPRGGKGGKSEFEGTLSGQWSGKTSFGPLNGTFVMVIGANGAVSGSYQGSDSGSIQGSVSSAGQANMGASGSAGGDTNWSGKIIRTGDTLSGSGTWSNADAAGVWRGSGKARSKPVGPTAPSRPGPKTCPDGRIDLLGVCSDG